MRKKVACDRTEKKEGERSQSKVQTIVLVPSALAVENTYIFPQWGQKF